ncbi:MAG: glycosyltransferase [Nitrospira sp.]|nr:glycosyltransferase [Nitrospira sp.]
MGGNNVPAGITCAVKRGGLKFGYFGFSCWLQQHFVLASLIILACSLGPRVGMAVLADPGQLAPPGSDSPTYLAPAINLIQSGFYLNDHGDPEVSRTPGYPVFLAALMSIVGKDVHSLAIAQSIVLSATVLLLYWLARKILPPVIAFTGCLLACVSPWGILQSVLILTEGLYLLLLTATFLLIRILEETTSQRMAAFWAAVTGALIGGTVLVRPVWPILIILAAVTVLRCGLRRKGLLIMVIILFASALTPMHLWTNRNAEVAGFNGLSDVPGKAAWFYLASRVTAQAESRDRWEIQRATMSTDNLAGQSLALANKERWEKAAQVFASHPVSTVWSFMLSAMEHATHPSPEVLSPVGMNFNGDYLVLASLWIVYLLLAYVGWRCSSDPDWDDGATDRGWLFAILIACTALTLSTGLTFGAGARMRAPLELIIPLLAGMGLVRIVRSFKTTESNRLPETQLPDEVRSKPVLAVLIPVFNEVQSIKRLVKRVLASSNEVEIRVFIVDDCSSDGSGAVLDALACEDSRITVLHHNTNQGKGAAIRTAINAATGDFAIIQDADFEYDPNDYSRIIAPLLTGAADAVFGSRYLSGMERQVRGYWHSLGNSFLTTCFNIVHDAHLSDMETCYKALPLNILKSLRLTTDRFGIEPELAARLIAVRARIVEVPISYYPRGYGDGKKIGWKDGLEAIYLIVKFKYFDPIPCLDAAMLRHLAMAKAPLYQKAIAREIEPFVGDRVLEVGAGIGNLSKHMPGVKELILAEPIKGFRLQLASNMDYRDYVIISEQDVFSEQGVVWAKNLQPDTVININQLELMDDDKVALDSLASSVAPRGRVVLLLSAQQSLYGSLDNALGRRRRYSLESIRALLKAVGLEVIEERWFGKLVLIGWFFESKIYRRQFFSPKSVSWVDLLSPWMKSIDRWMPWNGLSLLVVAQKSS